MNKRRVNTPGAVLYIRVSTEDQAVSGTSPETQREACLLMAAQADLPVIAVCEDLGVSGSRYSSRPGIQQALKLIETGAADTLIATKVDRVGRSAAVILDIARRVREAEADLVTGDYRFDDTPMGKFTLTMFAGMAEFERNNIQERTMKGKRKRAEEGQQPQRSTPAYGYHIVTNAQIECGLYPPELRGRYQVIEEEAEIVRELFIRYAAGGAGFAPLARDLNIRGVPASRGGRWHPACVSVILRNPVYKGQPAYGRTARSLGDGGPDDRHQLTGAPLIRPRFVEGPGKKPVLLTAPPLVTEELWNAAQVRLSDNQAQLVGSPKQARMLTGRVECPCGHRAAVVGSRGKKAYQCYAQRESRFLHGTSTCQTTTYPLLRTEQSVISSLQEAAEHPEVLTNAAQAYQARTHQQPTENSANALRRERAALDTALNQLRQEEAAAIQGQIAGIRAGASPDAYAAVFADLAIRRKDMENRRGAIAQALGTEAQSKKTPSKPAPRNDKELAQQALSDMVRVLSSEAVPGREKRDLVGTIISRVVCHPEGADIYYLPGVFPTVSPFANSMLTELIQ